MADYSGDWPGVFVSSTCYDLMDLRAELEACIRDLGLIPVMSDRPTSEFDVGGYQDSITTCIENVKKCPTFVCVLSNRYGPSLGKAGFDDISATHLEYRAAVASKRRILFYARDRLLAEHQLWTNAKRAGLALPKLPWVIDPKDYGVFEFLTEYKELSPGSDPNWVWPFRDSVELKQRLTYDLGGVSRRARLKALVEAGRVPIFAVAQTAFSATETTKDVTVQVSNVGPVPALEVELGLKGRSLKRLAAAIKPDGSVADRITIEEPMKERTKHILVLRYATQSGERIEEHHSFEPTAHNTYLVSQSHRSFRLVDGPAFEIE